MADVSVERILHVVKYMVGADQMKGVETVDFAIEENVKEGPGGDGAPGLASQDKTYRRIMVRPNFESGAPFEALLGLAEANVVVHYKISGGTVKTKTFKNVLHRGGNLNFPKVDATDIGKSTGTIGVCTWGPSDTLATMIVTATAT